MEKSSKRGELIKNDMEKSSNRGEETDNKARNQRQRK